MRQIIYGVHYAAVPPEQAFLHSVNLRRIFFNGTPFFHRIFHRTLSVTLQDELLKFLSLTRMLYWPQVHWLKLMAVMVGSINQASSFPDLPVHQFLIPTFRHPFHSQWKNSSTELSRSDENAVRALDRRTRRWIITGSVMALSGMLQVSRRARLQRGADLFWWQKVCVSAKWEESSMQVELSAVQCHGIPYQLARDAFNFVEQLFHRN